MELKLSIDSSHPRLLNCFNRTFMELKCIAGWTDEEIFGSFNRTFMELKSPLRKKRALCTWFQSYLYGIEMRMCRPDWRHISLVSIVPLWNWNDGVTQMPFIDLIVSIVPLWNWNTEGFNRFVQRQTFQSYLYGIEITLNTAAFARLKQVSIVPLWNWNKIFTTSVSIISWLSALYALNGRKVAMWILFRYEKVIFNVFNF